MSFSFHNGARPSPGEDRATGPILEDPDDLGTLSSLDVTEIDRFRPKAVVAGQTDWKDLFVYLASDPRLEIDPQTLSDVRDGSMSWVIRASQPAYGNRSVAIKVCKYDVTTPQGALFRAEIATTARLKHPGIQEVLGQGILKDGDLPYFLMHFTPGESLSEARLSWNEDTHGRRSSSDRGRRWRTGERAMALEALVQAAAALQYAHSCGVIHRDVKPSNVFVASATRAVYLHDFGLQHSADNLFPHAGTHRYAAPEQIDRSVGPISERTDVWGLGTCLLELMSDPKVPPGGNISQLLPALRVGPSRPPAELIAIAERCLSEGPAGRYKSAREVGEEIQRFLQGQPVRAYKDTLSFPGDWSYVGGRWASRNVSKGVVLVARHKVAAGLVTASLVGGGGATYWGLRVAEEGRERDLVQTRENAEREKREIRLKGLREVYRDAYESAGRGNFEGSLGKLSDPIVTDCRELMSKEEFQRVLDLRQAQLILRQADEDLWGLLREPLLSYARRVRETGRVNTETLKFDQRAAAKINARWSDVSTDESSVDLRRLIARSSRADLPHALHRALGVAYVELRALPILVNHWPVFADFAKFERRKYRGEEGPHEYECPVAQVQDCRRAVENVMRECEALELPGGTPSLTRWRRNLLMAEIELLRAQNQQDPRIPAIYVEHRNAEKQLTLDAAKQSYCDSLNAIYCLASLNSVAVRNVADLARISSESRHALLSYAALRLGSVSLVDGRPLPGELRHLRVGIACRGLIAAWQKHSSDPELLSELRATLLERVFVQRQSPIDSRSDPEAYSDFQKIYFGPDVNPQLLGSAEAMRAYVAAVSDRSTRPLATQLRKRGDEATLDQIRDFPEYRLACLYDDIREERGIANVGDAGKLVNFFHDRLNAIVAAENGERLAREDLMVRDFVHATYVAASLYNEAVKKNNTDDMKHWKARAIFFGAFCTRQSPSWRPELLNGLEGTFRPLSMADEQFQDIIFGSPEKAR